MTGYMHRVSAVFLTVSVLLLCCPGRVCGQDIESKKNEKARLEEEISILDRQLSENMTKRSNVLAQLNLVRNKVTARKRLIDSNRDLIYGYTSEIRSAQRQINALQDKLDTLSDYYGRLVLSAYKNRDSRIWYMYILASENLGQAFRRYTYFKNLSAQMNLQADRIKSTKAELEAEKINLNKLKEEAERTSREYESELKQLQKEEKQSADIAAALNRDRKKYERELAAKKRQIESLDREIQRLIAEAMGGAEKSDKKVEIDYKLASEFAANKGKLPWPVTGPVVERFGQNYHPVFKSLKLPFSNGISIAVSEGTRVCAVFDGVVKQIAVMPGYNQCVLVQHGNYFSFYCKLKSTAVKPGDKVRTGDIIGVVDKINGETQLHFQIWQKQTPQNPQIWLRPR